MLQRVVNFLTQEIPERSETTKPELAAAVLMMEIVAADHLCDPAEQRRVTHELIERFDLSKTDALELKNLASEHVDTSIALDEYVGAVNENFGPQEKYQLIRSLWRVAYADDELHHYEEYAIRRIADLLHVPHREFIRAKHERASSDRPG